MSLSNNGGPASSRSDSPAPYRTSTPARPSDHPPGQYPSKRKRPAAAPATNNQWFGNDIVSANEQCYSHPTTYPMNRLVPVDPNIAAAQLMAANLMFRQQGNAPSIIAISNTNFARAQNQQQYAADTLPNAMAPSPTGTQRGNGTPPLLLAPAPAAAPRPADNAHAASALPPL